MWTEFFAGLLICTPIGLGIALLVLGILSLLSQDLGKPLIKGFLTYGWGLLAAAIALYFVSWTAVAGVVLGYVVFMIGAVIVWKKFLDAVGRAM